MASGFYLPAYVLLALLIGGSARKFVGGDAVLMLGATPLLWLALGIWARLPVLPRSLLALPVALVVLQVVPGTAFLSSDVSDYGMALSRDIGRTLDSLAVTLVALAVFLCNLAAAPEVQRRLVIAVLVGVVANAVVALLQLATAQGFSLTDLFGYEMRAGFFRNRNHLACLLAIGVPVAGMVLPLAGAASWFAVTMILQLALGSDAGVVLTLLGGALLAFLSFRPTFRPLLLICLALVATGVVVLRGPSLVGEIRGDITRLTLAADTVEGISLTWPLGSGFGTFEATYPQVEKSERVIDVVVNHAHNDYLELVLEGGLPALTLILAYFACLAVAGRTAMVSKSGRLALVAIAVLLAHSAVDFPLRTLGLLTTFSVLNAIVFASQLRNAPRIAPRREAHALTT